MVEEATASLNNSLICIDLDSQLLDLDLDGNETPPRGHYFPPKDTRIDTFQNDDHADQQLRLSEDELRDLLRLFELDELTQVPMLHGDGSVTFCNFNREELLMHMLTKMSSRVTHKMMVEGVEPLTGGFGGSNTKWEQGYKWLVKYVDNKFYHLIGPDAIKMWVESFPSFRDHIYQYLRKPKRRRINGIDTVVQWDHEGAPTREEFNIASFADCTIYTTCVPGAGPVDADKDAPRGDDACVLQRSFFDGHHRVHDIKMLTIYGPNGMTLATYGPTSGRRKDPTLHEWSGWDDEIAQLCMQRLQKIFASFADRIFAGHWHCLRTAHVPLVVNNALRFPVPEPLLNENANMDSARECIEHGYGAEGQLLPLSTVKEHRKLNVDSELIYAETRVMLLLCNIVTCCRRGNVTTGKRMFGCPPPTLESYLNGTPHH